MVTFNVDKRAGLVNGAVALVDALRPGVVVLRMPSGEQLPLPRVTQDTPAGRRSGFPLLLGYATAIAKVQGQTLAGIVVCPQHDSHSLQSMNFNWSALARMGSLRL